MTRRPLTLLLLIIAGAYVLLVVLVRSCAPPPPHRTQPAATAPPRRAAIVEPPAPRAANVTVATEPGAAPRRVRVEGVRPSTVAGGVYVPPRATRPPAPDSGASPGIGADAAARDTGAVLLVTAPAWRFLPDVRGSGVAVHATGEGVVFTPVRPPLVSLRPSVTVGVGYGPLLPARPGEALTAPGVYMEGVAVRVWAFRAGASAALLYVDTDAGAGWRLHGGPSASVRLSQAAHVVGIYDVATGHVWGSLSVAIGTE